VESVTEAETAPPTALIEVLDAHGRIHTRFRLSSMLCSCTIGRSVVCDIVVDDPFAAAEHTMLALLDDGRVTVTDLGSRNGTRVDGERINPDAPTIINEGTLIVGRSHVRVRTALMALAPERLFRRDILQRHRTVLAALGLTSCAAFVAFNQWIAFPEPFGPRIFTAVIGALGAIALWISVWGLITRVSHGAWTLRTHIAIAANLVALCLWSDWLLSVAAFATQWRWLENVTVMIVIPALLGGLYLHLRKATQLSVRAAAIVSGAVPLVLGGAIAWIGQQATANDVNRIALGLPVYPPQVRVVAGADLNDYLGRAESLKRDANKKRRTSLLERPLAESD
jgi:hypothetical protein